MPTWLCTEDRCHHHAGWRSHPLRRGSVGKLRTPVGLGATRMKSAAVRSDPSTKASMKRTGLSWPTYSSSDSGNNRIWDRSGPEMCVMIRILTLPASISEFVPEEISHGLHEKRGSDFGPKSRGFERYQNARVAASSEAARPPARGKKNPAGARVINIIPLSDIAGRDCVSIGGSCYASTSTFSTWKGAAPAAPIPTSSEMARTRRRMASPSYASDRPLKGKAPTFKGLRKSGCGKKCHMPIFLISKTG